jgi:TRAP transporter T-component
MSDTFDPLRPNLSGCGWARETGCTLSQRAVSPEKQTRTLVNVIILRAMKSKSAIMHLHLLVIGLVCLQLCACSASTESATDTAHVNPTPDPALIAQADDCYAHRDDPARLHAGLDLLKRARAVAPISYDAAWRTARMAYTLGDQSKDDKERESAFRDGIEAGEAAVRIEPKKTEGHFWLGANYGGLAETEGPLAGLSDADKLRHEMETVQQLDPSYYDGSAYMALGQLDLEMPEWLGGDHQRALTTLEKGLQYGQQNPLLRLQLAKAYLANKKPDDARKQLNFILNMKPEPDALPEYKETANEARDLLKKQ